MAPAAPAFGPSVSQFAFGGVSGASHPATREEIHLMTGAHRPWATATYEAHKFARLIGEPDAPGTTGQAFFRSDDPAIYPAPACA